MSIINSIPKHYREGYVQLFKISNEDFLSVIEAFSTTSFTSSTISLAKNIAPHTNLHEDVIQSIFLSAGSVTRFLERGNTIEEIIGELCTLIEDSSLIDFKTEEGGKEKFSSRLSSLLNKQELYIASKASDLLSESGNVLLQSRIITDIRPIFNVNVEESPRAGIINHVLHIHYRDDIESDHRDIYFTLDSSDIKTLKDILIRAEKKEVSLQPIFKSSGIINLNE